jgi:hypothetical protein
MCLVLKKTFPNLHFVYVDFCAYTLAELGDVASACKDSISPVAYIHEEPRGQSSTQHAPVTSLHNKLDLVPVWRIYKHSLVFR